MAIASILTSFLLLLGLAQLTDISPIVEFVVALIGLGVAIDYSLLLVSRWREERAHGYSDEQAVERAMATAGRAVVVSGLTVAIGLLALIALPIPFLRSLGYGGVLIPLVSTLVAITLLPVVLAKLGARLDWPHRRSDDKRQPRVEPVGARPSSGGAGSLPARPGGPAGARLRGHRSRSSAPTTRHDRASRATPRTASWRWSIRASASARCSRTTSCSAGGRPRAGRGRAARRRGRPRRGRARFPALAAQRDRARRGRSRSPTAVARRRRGHARSASDDAAHAAGSGVRVGGEPAAERRLHRRRLRQLPADDRADRGRHLRPAGARASARCCSRSRRSC